MCSLNPTNILVIKTDTTELRVPYNSLSLSFEKVPATTPVDSVGPSPTANKFAEKLDLLKEKGFTNDAINIRVLTNQKGDMDRTVKRLEAITKKHNSRVQIDAGYTAELTILKEKGFTNENVNLRLLRKTNGDMERVIKRLEASKTRVSVPTKVHVEADVNIEKLNQLSEQGFTNERLNKRLLERNNGNVDATISQLAKVKCVRANNNKACNNARRVRK